MGHGHGKAPTPPHSHAGGAAIFGEHVAADAQPLYFAAAHRVLKPGGLFLNHCEVSVARARRRTLRQRMGDRLRRRNEFIEKYVFPDARLVRRCS